jgi:hypothetical protein
MTDIGRIEPLTRTERALALLLPPSARTAGPALDSVRDQDIHITYLEEDDPR